MDAASRREMQLPGSGSGSGSGAMKNPDRLRHTRIIRAMPAFRILLVEDEPVIRGLVETLLTTAEVQVECVSSGADAIKRARENPFDLYLLDIVLPGLDGVSVLRLLRADPANAAKPVYMLSGKQKTADMETAKRAGATGYIQKPFRGVELMELVDKHRAAKN